MKVLQAYISGAASQVHDQVKAHSTMCTCNTKLTLNPTAFVVPKLFSWNGNFETKALNALSKDIASAQQVHACNKLQLLYTIRFIAVEIHECTCIHGHTFQVCMLYAVTVNL